MTTHQVVSLAATLAALAILVVLGRTRLRPAGPGIAVVALGVVALLSHLSLPPFRPPQGPPINVHDFAHYYLGTKYFRELGYSKLYLCAYEASGRPAMVPTIRHMATRTKVPVPSVEEARRECRDAFGERRWSEFVWDVLFFRPHFSDASWRTFLNDHGFNATPTWIALAGLVTAHVPLSLDSVFALASVDAYALFALFALIAMALGALPAGLAFIALCGFQAVHGGWILGSLFRWDWVVLFAVSVVLAHRRMFVASGAVLAIACLLRVIPVAAVGALVFFYAFGGRFGALNRAAFHRIGIGFATGALLAAIGTALVLDFSVWPKFASHLSGLESTPALNDMGLRTALTYGYEWMRSGGGAGIVETEFAAKKRGLFAIVLPIQLALLGLGLVLFLRSRHREPGAVLALAPALIPLLWGEAANYYYAFWLILALVAAVDARLIIPLLIGNLATLPAAALMKESMALFAVHSAIAAAAALAVLWFSGRDRGALRRTADESLTSLAPPPHDHIEPAETKKPGAARAGLFSETGGGP